MDKQEFYKKLIRSLFLITAMVALSLALSNRTNSSCPTAKDCTRCVKLQDCSKTQTKGL